MKSEQPTTKPSLLQKISGPLVLFCAAGNIFVLIGDYQSTTIVGTVIHGLAIIALATLGIFLLRRYWRKQ